MTATYSPNLGITLMANGDNSNTWGLITNTNMGILLEQAISGYAVQTFADADVTLLMTNGASALARNMYIECQGLLTTTRSLIVPPNTKLYFVFNNTSGGQAIVVKGVGGTGISVPSGQRAMLIYNGVDIVSAVSYFPALTAPLTLTTTLTLPAGTTTIPPLKWQSGALTTTPVVGATEYDGTALYQTNAAGTRKTFQYTDGTGASGTWGISITGSAASATTATSATTAAGTTGNTFFTLGGGAAGTQNDIGVNCNGYPVAFLYSSATAWGLHSSAGGDLISYTRATSAISLGGVATIDASGNLTASAFVGSGASLTGTATSLSIGGNSATATTATTATTANAVNTGNSYQMASLGVGTTASGTAGEIRATNNVTAFYSDMRLKDYVGPLSGALDKVNALEGFYFKANQTAQDLGYTDETQVGVSAQQVQAVLPEIIRPAPIDPQYMTLDYAKLVPLLIESIKELTSKVEALEVRR